MPGHSVSEGTGIAHIRPICAIPPRRQRPWFGGASTGGDARRLRPEGDLRWLEVTAEVMAISDIPQS